jgi:hypothetical protein
LAIDQHLANMREGHRGMYAGPGTVIPAVAEVRLNPKQVQERRIIWNLLKHIQAAGFVLVSLWDGEEEQDVHNDPQTAMELIYNLDDSHLHCMPAGGNPEKDCHYLWFVMGNSPDEVLADYSYTEGDPDKWVACIESFDTERCL